MFKKLFNLVSKVVMVITNKPQTQATIVEAPVIVEVTPKAPREAKRKKINLTKVNPIDKIFLELSKEMNIPFVKGPFAPVAIKAPKVEKAPREPRVAQPKEIFVDNTGLITPGKKGVSNTQMIPALTAQVGNEANIRILFNAYPEVFMSTVKYMPKAMKLRLVSIVNEKYPEFKI